MCILVADSTFGVISMMFFCWTIYDMQCSSGMFMTVHNELTN